MRLVQDGLIEAPSQGEDRLPLIIEADVDLAQDPTVARTFYAGLTAHIYAPDGALIAEVDDVPWAPVLLPSDGQTFAFSWDPAELDAATHPASLTYTVELTAHLGVELRSGMIIPLDEELVAVDGQVERAAAIEALPPGADVRLEVSGTGSAADGVVVDIPKEALASAEGASLTVRPLLDLPAGGAPIQALSPAYEIELRGASLRSEITLTLPYDAAQAAVGGPPTISFFDEAAQAWQAVPTSAIHEGMVSAKTDHLSVWAVTDVVNFGLEGIVGCLPGAGGGGPCETPETLTCGLGGASPDCPAWWSDPTPGAGRHYRRLRAFGDTAHPRTLNLGAQITYQPATASPTPTFLAGDVNSTGAEFLNAACIKAVWGPGGLPRDATQSPRIPNTWNDDLFNCYQTGPEPGDMSPDEQHRPLQPAVDDTSGAIYRSLWSDGRRPGWHELIVYVVDKNLSHAFKGDEGETRCSEYTTTNFETKQSYSSILAYECLLLLIDPNPGPALASGAAPRDASATLDPQTLPACGGGGQPSCVDAFNQGWSATLVTLPETTPEGSPEAAQAACEAVDRPEGQALVARAADSSGEVTFAPMGGGSDATLLIHDPARSFIAQRGKAPDTSGSGTSTSGDLTGASVCLPLRVDQDGDGEPASHIGPCLSGDCDVDCDDQDLAINHDAAEICDRKDNNCDGRVDEGQLDGLYWLDEDGDGFGPGEPTAMPCPGPDSPFRAQEGGDCDDTRADVHPGADPRLLVTPDGQLIDSDCDGELPFGIVGVEDLDSDGHGEALRVSPTGDAHTLSALIDALVASQGGLSDADRGAGFTIPDTLALSSGTWRENLDLDGARLGDRTLSIVAASGQPTLDAGGAGCLAEGRPSCAAIWAHDGARVTLDGLSLVEGRGVARRGQGARWGGALFVDHAHLDATDLQIRRSQAQFGAAIALTTSGAAEEPATIQGSIIEGNLTLLTTPYGEGLASGAVYVSDSHLTLFGNAILNNLRVFNPADAVVDPGAGLTVLYSDVLAVANLVRGNVGASFAGIAHFTEVGGPSLALYNNTVEYNTATFFGGGLGRLAFAVEDPTRASADRVIGNVFAENNASLGGGMFIAGGPAAGISNNLFAHNLAASAGGGAYLATYAPQRFTQNTFDHDVFPSADLSTGEGAELYVATSPDDAPDLGGAPVVEKGAPPPRTDALANAFAPSLGPELAATCAYVRYDASLWWGAEGDEAALCEPASQWLVAGPEEAPFEDVRPGTYWTVQDYHLTPDFQDSADPDDASLADLDGSPGDAGAYGGPHGARGLGAFSSLCLDDPADAAGLLTLPDVAGDAGARQLRGALTSRDAPWDHGAEGPGRMDLYTLWLDAGAPVRLTLDSDHFDPAFAVLSPATTDYGSDPGADACSLGETLTAVGGPGVGPRVTAVFTAGRSGYYGIAVTSAAAWEGGAGLGPYELSWARLPG